MKILLLSLFSLVLASATTVSFTNNSTSQPGATTISFDGLDHNTPSPYTINNVVIGNWSAGNAPFFSGSQVNCNAALAGYAHTYIGVGGCGVPDLISITFTTPATYIEFLLGSPDAYNVFQLWDGAALVAQYTGAQLVPPGTGDQSVVSYVRFNITKGSVNQLVVASTSPAAEFGKLSYSTAIPEPNTLFLIGVGLSSLSIRKYTCLGTQTQK